MCERESLKDFRHGVGENAARNGSTAVGRLTFDIA